MSAAPLTGRRILVTRAAHQAGKLSDGLRALGAEPVEVPVLEIQPPLDTAPLDNTLRRLAGQANDPGFPILSASFAERVGTTNPDPAYDWLIFTSANTVRAVVERAAALGISFAGAILPKIAAIGEATATAARNAGFSVALIPPTYVAESLVDSLTIQTKTRKILLARAEIARDLIPDALRAAGAAVHVVDAYRNVLPDSAPALLRAALEQGIDAATFTSSSSATHLAEAARAAAVAFPFPGVPAISIGPITSATLRELGWEPAAQASCFDIPGLIQAVRSALGNS